MKRNNTRLHSLLSALLGASLLLTGCSGGAVIENELPSKLLKTENTRPEGRFDDIVVNIAKTEQDMANAWEEYGMSGNPPHVNFDDQEVYFVGIYENSCELEFAGTALDESEENLIVHVGHSSNACDDIGIPRTYVLAIDNEALTAVRSVSIQEWYGKNKLDTSRQLEVEVAAQTDTATILLSAD
ncbi:hypothetical protein [Paenibacillus sp. 1P07SE]|uniref:hypothetical protein n=1 Tax=Paenibacillus sp. 1P07SE TaxID=3132209 RepID=UPI0039A599E1